MASQNLTTLGVPSFRPFYLFFCEKGMYHIKENKSTVHPFFFTKSTLRNRKITTRPQLFFFFLSSSRRRRSPVLQAEQRFDQPPTSPFQIKEQTPSIGKLQDILSERTISRQHLDLAPHPPQDHRPSRRSRVQHKQHRQHIGCV